MREHLAALGFRTLEEAIGHAELLDTRAAVEHWKAAGLDLTPILHVPDLPEGASRHRTTEQDHGLDKALDHDLITMSADALENGEPVRGSVAVRNVNRTVGTMLGHEVTRRYGADGLAPGTIDLTLTGSGGPVVRRVRAARHHPAARRRRQRLRRQGPVRRHARRAAGPGVAVRRGGERGRRQRHRLRRDVGRDLPARPGRRAVLRPQLRRHRGRRGRGRPRLRVHDRRHGRRARPDRAQLRRRHVRRHGVRARPRPAPAQPAGAGVGRARAGARSTPTTSRGSPTCCAGTSSTPARRWRSALLDHPASIGERFSRLVPREYARVLEVRSTAEDEGLDPDGDVVWSRIMEGTRG